MTRGRGWARPVLLYNDECGVCRRIAAWVKTSATERSGYVIIDVRPIGEDAEALRRLSPTLDIWDAYATVHLLMPDGAMKVGGEAVAEVLRLVPRTMWFAWLFNVSVLKTHPFQWLLDLSYAALAESRALLGCGSCGAPQPWMKPIARAIEIGKRFFGTHADTSPRSTPVSVLRNQMAHA